MIHFYAAKSASSAPSLSRKAYSGSTISHLAKAITSIKGQSQTQYLEPCESVASSYLQSPQLNHQPADSRRIGFEQRQESGLCLVCYSLLQVYEAQ